MKEKTHSNAIKMKLIAEILSDIPKGLRDPLLKHYNDIVQNYIEHRWEPSELNGGKLCEVVYTILKGYIEGKYPSKPSKPRNMVVACRKLEEASSKINRSIKIQIPRMLLALYEIRNNRGVGHTGGDVDPNQMDATAVLYMSKWIMAELVRSFHGVDTKTATDMVNSIVERIAPTIWEVNGKYRVLDTSLNMKQKTLLLLYQQTGQVAEEKLIDWIEHTNPSNFRRDILKKSHKEKLIEYDQKSKFAQISPKGIDMVEEMISAKQIVN